MSAQGMPPNLMALFAPRAPLVYLAPPETKMSRGFRPTFTGVHNFIRFFSTEVPERVQPAETPNQRRERKKREKLEEHKNKQKELILQYNPANVDCATKNPYATLFVGRLSYETTEKKLKKEFEVYGPIKRLKVITDFNGKSRGYAFIEYEHESDLKQAYKQGDGKKIDGRRVLVDVERSRTVPGWIPRRLGGGKGPARFTEVKKKAVLRTLPTIGASSSIYSTQATGTWDHSVHGSHGHRASNSGYGPSSRGMRSSHSSLPHRHYDGRGNGSSRQTSRREDGGNPAASYSGRNDTSSYSYHPRNSAAPSDMNSNMHVPADRENSTFSGSYHDRNSKTHGKHIRRSSRGYGSKRYRSNSHESERYR